MSKPDPAPPGAGVPETVVLLVNLGTPDAPTPPAVRRYLAEFLADPRVIDLPRWLWLPILYGAILQVRPRRSAHAYASIWTEAGSPLRVFSESLAQRLDTRVRELSGNQARVELAMRYGAPSIADTLERLRAEGMRRLLVLPLYPQYSATSTGTVFDAVTTVLQRWRWPAELRFVNDYHADAGYIAALAASIAAHRAHAGVAERLLLSFHGIPQRYASSGDPYAEQCRRTAHDLAAAAGLGDDELIVAFQSRVGREPWLQPYTDATLRELPARGVRSVQVLCPGFAVDCLETLEEIAIADREIFLAAGGERYEYVPALNDGAAHVEVMLGIVRRHTAGWFELGRAAAPG
jgi:ferrochelatase